MSSASAICVSACAEPRQEGGAGQRRGVVVEQRLDVEIRVEIVAIADAQIEIAALEGDRILLGADLDAESRALDREPRDAPRQPAVDQRERRADDQPGAPVAGAHARAQLGEALQAFRGLGLHGAAGVGQRHAVVAALEQAPTVIGFEIAHVLADGGGRDAKFARRANKSAGAGGGLEGAERIERRQVHDGLWLSILDSRHAFAAVVSQKNLRQSARNFRLERAMHDILDLDAYPLDRPDSPEHADLLARCRADLEREGMFQLDGLVREDAVARAAEEIAPLFETDAFLHERAHNIYFKPAIPELPADHPALAKVKTSNRTLCADQVTGAVVLEIYEWPPLARFIAAAMDKPALHVMADPLARVNLMRYAAGQALNWHFDRSEFTTTLLLQAPERGGLFEYRKDLRSETDPNYDGVARLLRGKDPEKKNASAAAGALTVFRGKNTAHRVTPAEGATPRIIAVFSYYEKPGVTFSDEERIGFYGRAA